jgi:hypothetical protein
VHEIAGHAQYEGHTGFSFALALRQVRYLVSNGFDNFVDARGDLVILDGRLTQ